jgi:hypothetical protein
MRGLSEKTLELIAFARLLLVELHPMTTLRQLHYAIFSAASTRLQAPEPRHHHDTR